MYQLVRESLNAPEDRIISGPNQGIGPLLRVGLQHLNVLLRLADLQLHLGENHLVKMQFPKGVKIIKSDLLRQRIGKIIVEVAVVVAPEGKMFQEVQPKDVRPLKVQEAIVNVVLLVLRRGEITQEDNLSLY